LRKRLLTTVEDDRNFDSCHQRYTDGVLRAMVQAQGADLKSSYSRWLVISIVLGLLMPIFWFLAQWLFPQAPNFLYPLERLTRVLWPSSIWLMATDGGEGAVSSYAVILVSVTANVLLYVAVGSSMWFLKKRVVGRLW
jgi:hypothetical protein